jgi:hypothetical protein
MSLNITEENEIIVIEESSESNGGFKIIFCKSGMFELVEIKPSGEEYFCDNYENIYNAIKEGRRWT